jgi:hypothetical protein
VAAPVRCRCRPPPRTEVSPAVAEQPKRCQKQVSRTLSRTRRVRTFCQENDRDRVLGRNPVSDCADGVAIGLVGVPVSLGGEEFLYEEFLYIGSRPIRCRHTGCDGKTASAASCDGICALLSQGTVQRTRRDEGRRRVKSARRRAGQ